VIANPASATFMGAGCSAASVTAPPGGNSVSLSGAAINAGSRCLLQVNATPTTTGVFVNHVNAGAFLSTQGVTNANPATATLTVTGQTDLAVTKTILDRSVIAIIPGRSLTYTIMVTNAGPDGAAGATVTDNAPPGSTFTSWTCAGSMGALCTGTGSGNIADTATIPAGGSVTYTVNAAFDPDLPPGTFTNSAMVSPPPRSVDSDPGNNSSSFTLRVVPVTTLDIFKTDGVETYSPGATQTYVITVVNLGPSDAADVTVSDLLPDGVTLKGPAPDCLSFGSAVCGTLASTPSAVELSGGRIPAGIGNGFLITVPIQYASNLAVDPLINTATASDEASGGSHVNSDTDRRQPAVALSTLVDDGTAIYVPGSTGTYIVTVTNSGASDALDVGVDVPLPAGVTLNGPATCVSSAGSLCGTVTGDLGAGSANIAGALIGATNGNLVLSLPAAFAPSLTADPLVVAATAADASSGATAAGQVTATCAPAGGGALCGLLSVTGTQVHGNAFTLPAGGSITVIVTGVAPITGTLVDSALATPPVGAEDPNPADNSSGATTTVTPAPPRTADVSISKSAAEQVTAGAPIVYTLAIRNAGPGTADGTTFTDDLPAGLSATAATCAAAGGRRLRAARYH
jgi:uncharacterized repeat protein (TIGR01451 family)